MDDDASTPDEDGLVPDYSDYHGGEIDDDDDGVDEADDDSDFEDNSDGEGGVLAAKGNVDDLREENTRLADVLHRVLESCKALLPDARAFLNIVVFTVLLSCDP